MITGTARMYICICNALNEKAVEGAVADGARTAGEVYLRLGCRPQCARCVPEVAQRVRASRVGAGSDRALAQAPSLP